MGFNWANHCDMFNLSNNIEEMSGFRDDENVDTRWRMWISEEVQHRALLGHLILDGQLTCLSGQPGCSLHISNPFRLSACSDNFNAKTSDEWLAAMNAQPQGQVLFRDIYSILLDPAILDEESNGLLERVESSMDMQVILEGLNYIASATRESTFPKSILSTPSIEQIRLAIFRVFQILKNTWNSRPVDRLELMIKCHFAWMNTYEDIMSLCSAFCIQTHISQHIFKWKVIRNPIDITGWVQKSRNSRALLLHAVAIQDIATQLPLSHIHTPWMPIPIFIAASIYSMYRFSGISTISIPQNAHWITVLSIENILQYDSEGLANNADVESTKVFLCSHRAVSRYSNSSLKNLAFDVHWCQTILHGLALQWRVCMEMEEVVRTWSSYSVLNPTTSRSSLG
jgi:hypothetical protein